MPTRAPSTLPSAVVQKIVHSTVETEMEQEEERILDSLTIEKKLRCAAVTKCLLDNNYFSESAYVPLRVAQRSSMRQRVQSMPQTCTTEFFSSK